MTFEEFVDGVDAGVRSVASADYGVFRGPSVAYWQFAERTARLRAGANGDVRLDADGGLAACDARCDRDGVIAIGAALAAFAGFLETAR